MSAIVRHDGIQNSSFAQPQPEAIHVLQSAVDNLSQTLVSISTSETGPRVVGLLTSEDVGDNGNKVGFSMSTRTIGCNVGPCVALRTVGAVAGLSTTTSLSFKQTEEPQPRKLQLPDPQFSDISYHTHFDVPSLFAVAVHCAQSVTAEHIFQSFSSVVTMLHISSGDCPAKYSSA